MESRIWAGEVVSNQVVRVAPESLAEKFVRPEGFVWVHVRQSDPSRLPDPIKEALQSCPLTLHDLNYSHLRSGLENRRGALAFLASVPQVQGEETEYLTLGVFVHARWMITLTHRSCPDIEELFDAWEDDPEDLGEDAPGLLHSVLDAVLDTYFPVLDRCHEQAEVLEESVYASQRIDPTGPLGLKREFLTLRKQIGPIRDTLNALIRFGAPLIPPAKLPDFNDLLNHALRITENIDLGRDIVSSIMDAQLGVVSNRLNEIMRTLTVISTLLMVCSLIAGIYGMNFARMPELGWVYGYPFALFLMAVACLVAVWLFKRRGWF